MYCSRFVSMLFERERKYLSTASRCDRKWTNERPWKKLKITWISRSKTENREYRTQWIQLAIGHRKMIFQRWVGNSESGLYISFIFDSKRYSFCWNLKVEYCLYWRRQTFFQGRNNFLIASNISTEFLSVPMTDRAREVTDERTRSGIFLK